MEPGNHEAYCIFSPAKRTVTKLVGSTHMPQKVKAGGAKTLRPPEMPKQTRQTNLNLQPKTLIKDLSTQLNSPQLSETQLNSEEISDSSSTMCQKPRSQARLYPSPFLFLEFFFSLIFSLFGFVFIYMYRDLFFFFLNCGFCWKVRFGYLVSEIFYIL